MGDGEWVSSAGNLGFLQPPPVHGPHHPRLPPAGGSADLPASLSLGGTPTTKCQAFPGGWGGGQSTEGEKGLACLALRREGQREIDLGMMLIWRLPSTHTALPLPPPFPDHRTPGNSPAFPGLPSFPRDFPINREFWI